MFKSATIKLTAWYLALIMGLSLAFSFVLYQTSASSIGSEFDRQRAVIRQQYQNHLGIRLTPIDLDQLRSDEMTAAQQRLLASLTLINVAVLAVGGAASFYMARRTLQPIEQALEAQTRFTADASHELRTPLTAMQTEIEVALRDPDLTLQEAKQQLQSDLEEVGKLQALGNGLLALAQYDRERISLQRIALKPIVAEAVARAAKSAERRHIEIKNDAADAATLGDRDGLTQLFSILLDNAIKYSPAKTIITLSSQIKGGHVLIAVTDQGHGIKSADLPHIFDRLYRADSSRAKHHVDGYGLGLSIAKKIVQLHGGAIDVATKAGSGSTFTVRLPHISEAI